MRTIPQNVSESTKRLNPHLYTYTTGIAPTGEEITIITKSRKRIRQSSKPQMNKLEEEWMCQLAASPPPFSIHPQRITFKLANGLRYTPDFFAFEWKCLGELD